MSGVLEVEDGGVSIDCVRGFFCIGLVVLFVAVVPLTIDVPFEAELLALFVNELESRVVLKFMDSEGLIDGAAERFLPLRVFWSVEWDLGWLVRFWFCVQVVCFFFFN